MGASFELNKTVLVNCDPTDPEYGAVFIYGRQGGHGACRVSPVAKGGEGFLVWVEEFAKRLDTAYYKYIQVR